ncbi:hypothetical protein JOM56_010084 [Amanita muscaria]
MGRRAKYLTQEEKMHAARERKAQLSSIPIGKILRSAQNHAAYQRRISNKPQKQPGVFSGPASVHIPSLLKEHAGVTLPTSSRLFKSAYRCVDELADTEYEDQILEKWDNIPPYTIELENKACQWLSANVHSLSDALHGKNLRKQREYEDRRIHHYKSMPLTDFAIEVYHDLTFYLRSWEGANGVMEQFNGDNAVYKIGMQYVQWMARRSFHLWEDYEALKKGSDAILCDYVERWIDIDRS